MTDRNQQLTADLKDGPLSGYEWTQWQDCENCLFSDQTKLQLMEDLQRSKLWLIMDVIKGWCSYAFKHHYNKNTKPWTCLNWRAKEKSK